MTAAAEGCYSSYSGTSFSAPYVSGLAALIWSEYPHFTVREVRNVILNSVKKSSGLTGLVLTSGKIDAFAALSSPDARDNPRGINAGCGGVPHPAPGMASRRRCPRSIGLLVYRRRRKEEI